MIYFKELGVEGMRLIQFVSLLFSFQITTGFKKEILQIANSYVDDTKDSVSILRFF